MYRIVQPEVFYKRSIANRFNYDEDLLDQNRLSAVANSIDAEYDAV